MIQQETLLTADGLERLKAELAQLVEVRRPAISARIKEARELGDLKENAEYHDAKNEQSMVETKIKQLDARIRTARVVTAEDTSKVGIGMAVTVKDHDSGDVETWNICGAAEADPMEWRVSNESPIGAALMGTSVGDTVTVRLPAGESTLTVQSIAVS